MVTSKLENFRYLEAKVMKILKKKITGAFQISDLPKSEQRTILYAVPTEDGIIIFYSLEGIKEQSKKSILDSNDEFDEDDADSEYFQEVIDSSEMRHLTTFQSDYGAGDEEPGSDEPSPIVNRLRNEREKDVWEEYFDDSEIPDDSEDMPDVHRYDMAKIGGKF